MAVSYFAAYQEPLDLLHESWALILNVDWDKQNDEWMDAVIEFRSKFHSVLDGKYGKQMTLFAEV